MSDRKEQPMAGKKSYQEAAKEAREMLVKHMKLLLEYERKNVATPAGLQAMTEAATLLGVGC